MSLVSYVQSLWGATPSLSNGASSATPDDGGRDRVGRGFPHSVPRSTSNSVSAQQLGSGVWPLSAPMKEEMKKGIRYNMKVVLRGTRATGKSTLMARLSAHPLPTRYVPSTELTASTLCLHGELSAPHEGTKVDLWEVVEEGRQLSASPPPPLNTTGTADHISTAQLREVLRLATEARLADVYGGCQLVIFMVDPRQRASWDYAKRETARVPPTCCILYALNFSDQLSGAPSPPVNDVVTLSEVSAWCHRVRCATTNLVWRMLEGREAPAEFSVLPMTVVLSALTGSGMIGVVRALHVASTLLRITVEEVRVQRLFSLLARQQAVPLLGVAEVSGGNSLLPPLSMAPTGKGAAGTAADATLDQNGVPTALAVSCYSDRLEQREKDTAVNVRAAAKVHASPARSAELRMEHHQCADSATVYPFGDEQSALYFAQKQRGATSTHHLSDAEAIDRFLGSDDLAISDHLPSPSSSSPSVGDAASRENLEKGKVPELLCARTPPLSAAAAKAMHRRVEGTMPTGVRVPSAIDTFHCRASADAVTVGAPESTPPTTLMAAQLPSEEARCSLATRMVCDADAPFDEFFASEAVAGNGDSEEVMGEDEGRQEENSVGLTADVVAPTRNAKWRTVHSVETRRTVPGTSSSPSATVHPHATVSPTEVSTLVAQMTAAFAADLPDDEDALECGGAVARAAPTDPSFPDRGAKAAKSASEGAGKPKHTSGDPADRAARHRHRRKRSP